MKLQMITFSAFLRRKVDYLDISYLPYHLINSRIFNETLGSGILYFSLSSGPQEFEPTPAIAASTQITFDSH